MNDVRFYILLSIFLLIVLFCVQIYLQEQNSKLLLINLPLKTMDKALEEEVRELQWVFNQVVKGNARLKSDDAFFISRAILKYCKDYNVHPSLVLSIIQQESGFNIEAVSPKGALGLMQLMPGTAYALSQQMGFEVNDLYDIDTNIRLGVYYLKCLAEIYPGDEHAVLTAYNRGPTGLERFVQRHGSTKSSYSREILGTLEQHSQ
ncbi:MAG: lytic transglycosylase domain-containing protein [Bacillota bacterium]